MFDLSYTPETTIYFTPGNEITDAFHVAYGLNQRYLRDMNLFQTNANKWWKKSNLKCHPDKAKTAEQRAVFAKDSRNLNSLKLVWEEHPNIVDIIATKCLSFANTAEAQAAEQEAQAAEQEAQAKAAAAAAAEHEAQAAEQEAQAKAAAAAAAEHEARAKEQAAAAAAAALRAEYEAAKKAQQAKPPAPPTAEPTPPPTAPKTKKPRAPKNPHRDGDVRKRFDNCFASYVHTFLENEHIAMTREGVVKLFDKMVRDCKLTTLIRSNDKKATKALRNVFAIMTTRANNVGKVRQQYGIHQITNDDVHVLYII